MSRCCPKCDAALLPLAIRCQCGYALPESRDLRSDPEEPSCGVCGTVIGLMDERCSCGAVGYPALRPRQGKKCQRAGEDALLIQKPD